MGFLNPSAGSTPCQTPLVRVNIWTRAKQEEQEDRGKQKTQSRELQEFRAISEIITPGQKKSQLYYGKQNNW